MRDFPNFDHAGVGIKKVVTPEARRQGVRHLACRDVASVRRACRIARTGVTLHFIQPGKPVQGAYVESFNGRFRDACLNQHWFADLREAKRLIADWRHHYNHVRPHSSLGYVAPAAFLGKVA